MEVRQGAATDYIDLRLYDELTPDTVVNFLQYVNTGRYINSFIHRSVSDFVIQGGGFTFDPSLNDGTFTNNPLFNDYPGGLQPIDAYPPVKNEFKLTNERGTIAMAKQPGDPDSATSQWFINLVDNSSILDGQNGGFTVFGEVISSGMTVVDTIAAVTTFDKTDIHTAFSDLPLLNYTLTDPVEQQNLVRTSAITELVAISADIDFKAVLINTSVQSDINIRNSSNTDHVIGDIASTDTVNTPFAIVSDSCSNTTLTPDDQCTLTVQFTPDAERVFDDTFNIELTDLSISYVFGLAGEGVLVSPAPDIAPSLQIVEFGEVQLYNPDSGFPEQSVVFIYNEGNVDLNISSMVLEGTDAADFEIFDNCVTFSPVAPNAFCVLPINFKPLTTGEKSASITIISDDPDESPLVIPLTGVASIDTDGVPVAVEDAAPDGGDGNNDGILDSIQNNVASLPSANGAYITLLTQPNVKIGGIAVLSGDQMQAPPDNVDFDLGAIEFRIENVFAGSTVEVGLILPPGMIASTYYMYGPTPDNTNPHWYEFLYDGTTGAILLGNATLTAPDGTRIERNLVRLVFKDGERGDADLSANGVILDPGAPVVTTSSSGSGSIGLLTLFMTVPMLILLRNQALQTGAGRKTSVRRPGR